MKRVLVVDDDRTTTLLLKRVIERTGRYEVREENFGEQAVAAAREFMPDLIFLDVMMPNLDGSEVAGQLKDNPITSRIPVVFLTSIVTEEDVANSEGIIAGSRFIAKPVDAAQVVECLDELLR